MKLAVTIDTEADAQWGPGVPATTRNVDVWEPFQELCERHGVTPTYVITSEIAEDERARELLSGWSQRGGAEVGAHLHPWTTPPYLDRAGLRENDSVHAFPSQLPGHPGLFEIPVTLLSTYAPLRRSTALLEAYRSLPCAPRASWRSRAGCCPSPCGCRPTRATRRTTSRPCGAAPPRRDWTRPS